MGSAAALGAPNGFNAYERFSEDMRDSIEIFHYGMGGKIMNLIGSGVFELGFFILLINLYLILKLYFRRFVTLRFCLFVLLILNLSISASSGFAVILMGLLLFAKSSSRKYAESDQSEGLLRA